MTQTSNNYLQHHSKILDPKVQQAILRAGEDCKGPASCSNAVAMLDAQAKLLSDGKIAAMCGGDPSCVADRRIERSFYVRARDAATGRLGPDVAAASFLRTLSNAPFSEQQLGAAISRIQEGKRSEQPVDKYARHGLASNPVMFGAVLGLSLIDTDGGKGTAKAPSQPLPGMQRPTRSPSQTFPPDSAVVEAMRSPHITKLVNEIDCVGCSEIAERLYRAFGGKGQILEVTPKRKNNLNVYENGQLSIQQRYHQIYTDGRYVYDPRLSPEPIPKGDWEQHMRTMNPEGINISNKLKGLR